MNDTQQHDNPRAAAKAAKAYAKATRPWYRKKRWIGAILILVLVVLAVATSGGEGGASRVDDGGADPASVSKADPIAVGDTVELEGTRYTVASARTSPTVGGEFLEEQAGGVYVVVELTIENVKDETTQFLDSSARFVAANDKRYETDFDGTIAATGDDGEALILEDMQHDVPKAGILVFDVPEAAVKGGLLEVSDLFGRGEAYIDLGL